MLAQTRRQSKKKTQGRKPEQRQITKKQMATMLGIKEARVNQIKIKNASKQ